MRSAFEGVRDRAQARLEAYGVDPSMLRGGSIDTALDIGEAASSAAAQNNARRLVEDRGMALQGSLLGFGRGLSGDSTGQFASGASAGYGAGSTALSPASVYSGALMNPAQYLGIAGNAGSSAAGMMTQSYSNQLNAYNAQQAANAANDGGLNSLLGGLGTAAGFGLSFLPAEEGGAIPNPRYGVPMRQPPGAAERVSARTGPGDQVPALLEPGEYVVPEDVVSRLGTKFFEGLIERERKATGALPVEDERGGAPAPVPQAPPQAQRALPPAAVPMRGRGRPGQSVTMPPVPPRRQAVPVAR